MKRTPLLAWNAVGAVVVDFYTTGGTTVLTSTGATVAPSNCP